jgi:thiol-disulfide isomerase/thioredoxin
MDPLGAALLAAALVGAAAFGLWRRQTDGRLRAAPPAAEAAGEGPGAAAETLTAEDLGAALGPRATLVQFSTAFCQPCRATRRILDEVSGMVDGVAHVEIDAESRLDLVRRFDVTRTPTVLVLDPRGRITRRASGAPRKADVIAALGDVPA